MTVPNPLADAYFRRLGLVRAPAADLAGLEQLVAAHRLAIPFENLAIPLGHGISIDPAAIAAKLVHSRRGGYCFEQNGLLGAMLRAIGFAARPLLARVRLGLPEDACPPRTHTLSLVDLSGEAWIADAGFGGSFVPPLRLADGAMRVTADGAAHRLLRRAAPGSAAGEWLLQRRSPGQPQWDGQYTFDLAEVAAEDLEQANHWTATRPGTRFTSQVIASRVLPDGFLALTGRTVSRYRAEGAEKREIATATDLHRVLIDEFGIVVSEDEAKRLFAFAAG